MRSSLPGLAGLSALSARLNEIGFERTRRAIAALGLSVFVSLYLLIALSAPEGLTAVMIALAICYGVAFVGVVSEWFWGRWFASGLGWSGIMVAIAALVTIGWMPPLVIYGAVHGLVVLALMGKKMAARYDLQEGWRQRFAMDEFGVARLKKTVTRSAAALPSLIIWALGPKDGQSFVLALAALTLGVAGFRGLTLLKTWGLIALAGSVALVTSTGDVVATNFLDAAGPSLATLFLIGALLPFMRPIARYLLDRRSPRQS